MRRYYHAPDGKNLRSMPDVHRWLEANEAWAPADDGPAAAPGAAADADGGAAGAAAAAPDGAAAEPDGGPFLGTVSAARWRALDLDARLDLFSYVWKQRHARSAREKSLCFPIDRAGVSRELRARWDALDAAARERYDEAARADRERYFQEDAARAGRG